jgi:hypothetical protein
MTRLSDTDTKLSHKSWVAGCETRQGEVGLIIDNDFAFTKF